MCFIHPSFPLVEGVGVLPEAKAIPRTKDKPCYVPAHSPDRSCDQKAIDAPNDRRERNKVHE
jgi:hypothetical protein